MTNEEAIEIIESRNFYCIECIDRSDECCEALEMAIEALSAEKTAEWRIVGKTTLHYECSKCGGAGDKWDKFCKNCGADMRKKSEEE